MSDDTPRDDESAEQAAQAARERSRASAQHAARDLARMGIDPRSLGLDGPMAPLGQLAPPAQPYEPPDRSTSDPAEQTGRIVPLRPEFATDNHAAARTAPAAPLRTTPAAPAAPPPGGVGPVEQMLARTSSQKRPPKSPGRWMRAVTLGLVTPDAAEASGNERELVATLRHRQTERRVVTFMAGKGGVGTTSIACGVGAAFAALRDDHTALLDIQPGTPSLSRLHGLAEAMSAGALLRSGEDVVAPRTPAGLTVVDGVGWEQPLARRDLAELVDRLGADNTFNLVDAGNDPGEAAHAAIARCDQAVIVTSIGAMGTAALDVAVSRLRQVNPFAVERAVYVVVCQHDEPHRRVHREITQQLSLAPARVVLIPPDASLRAGHRFDPALVGAGVREAMLEIGAAIALTGAER